MASNLRMPASCHIAYWRLGSDAMLRHRNMPRSERLRGSAWEAGIVGGWCIIFTWTTQWSHWGNNGDVFRGLAARTWAISLEKTTTEKNYNMYTICGIPNEATLESWILRHGQNIIILINMNELLQGGYFLCASLYFFFKKNYGQNIIIIQRSLWNYWPFYVYILQR